MSNYVLIFGTAFPFGWLSKRRLKQSGYFDEIHKIKDGQYDPGSNYSFSHIAEINNVDEIKLSKIKNLVDDMESEHDIWSILLEVPPEAESMK